MDQTADRVFFDWDYFDFGDHKSRREPASLCKGMLNSHNYLQVLFSASGRKKVSIRKSKLKCLGGEQVCTCSPPRHFSTLRLGSVFRYPRHNINLNILEISINMSPVKRNQNTGISDIESFW